MIVYSRATVLAGTIPQRRKPVGTTRRGTIHTTEVPTSRGWYDTARSKDYYTWQYSPLGWGGSGGWLQVLDPTQISHALYRRGSDPQTNGEGMVNPSLVLLGYSRDIGLLNEEDVANLAHFFVEMEDKLGIPAVFPHPFGGSECWGEFSPCRLTWAEWRSVAGWVGHQMVPGQATGHWDPGGFPVSEIEPWIAYYRDPDPEPPLPPPRLRRRPMYPLIDRDHFIETVPLAEVYGMIDSGLIGLIDKDVEKTKRYYADEVFTEPRNKARADWDNLIEAYTVAHWSKRRRR